jgi:hypothetical protein
VSAAAVILAAATLTVTRAAMRARIDDGLLNAAESGAELALNELARGRPPWDSARDLGVPGARARVSIAPSPAGGWQVTSLARRRDRVCEVRLTARPEGPGRVWVIEWRAAHRNEPPR